MAFTKKFGIEIEFAGAPPDYVIGSFARRGIAIRNNEYDVTTWCAKRDGSIRGDENPDDCEYTDEDGNPCCDCDACCGYNTGCEIVSPPMPFGNAAIEQIKAVAEAIAAVGGYTNDSCGLHVHVNATFMRQWRPARAQRFFQYLRELYAEYEDVFDERMDDSRNHNDYCKSMSDYSGGRYYKLNTESFMRHGTIEFRHHHGTINAEEMVEWVKTCLLFFNIAKEAFRSEEFKAEFFAQDNENDEVVSNSACVEAII